jgi:hypothetical protein
MMQESQPAFDNQPDSSVRMDQDFRNEVVRFKAKSVSSEYKGFGEGNVDNYDFTQQYKLTMKNTINANLDPNAMLARNESTEMRSLMLEAELNLNVLAYESSDTQNPGHVTIETTFINVFRDFISPSLGGRVRDRITIEESEHHAAYTGLPQNPGMEPQGQRGFFNRGPGR